MLDLLNETRISLRDLAQREGVHVSTAWRWLSRGVKGARLPSYVRAGRRYTTVEAFQRWVVSTNDADKDGAPLTETTRSATINDEQFLVDQGA
jgi:transposase